MKDIIIKHYKKYPLMEIQDYVKLVYQHTFGGGHLIKDEDSCFKFLESEYKSATKSDEEVFEDIGSGLVRVSLHSYKGDLKELFNAFVLSSTQIKGSVDDFNKNLCLLLDLAKEKKIGIGFDELNAYLEEYKKKGYPMVSHSKTFKDAYDPSYRVVFLTNIIGDKNGRINQ